MSLVLWIALPLASVLICCILRRREKKKQQYSQPHPLPSQPSSKPPTDPRIKAMKESVDSEIRLNLMAQEAFSQMMQTAENNKPQVSAHHGKKQNTWKNTGSK